MLLNVDTWFGRKRQCLQNTLPKDSKETKAEVEDIDTCERYSCALQHEKTKFNLLLSHISWERERLFNRLAVTKRLENEKTIYMDATRLSSICTTAKYLLILHKWWKKLSIFLNWSQRYLYNGKLKMRMRKLISFWQVAKSMISDQVNCSVIVWVASQIVSYC